METRKIDLTPGSVSEIEQPLGRIAGLKDVMLDVTVVVGRSSITLEQLSKIGRGAVIELNKLVGQPVDVLVNGTTIAKGELVVIEDHIGVSLTEVLREK